MKKLLLALLVLSTFLTTQAQAPFSKTYSLKASASSFQAIAPHGSDGAFMAMAIVADSLSKEQVIKIIRYNSMGEAQVENIIRHPDYPSKRIMGNVECLTKVHDNLYAILGTRFVDGAQMGGFVMTIDSNGLLLQIRDIFVPAPGTIDTFTYTSALRYDGWGNILVTGHAQGSTGSSSRGDMLLQKYDTALNLIWQKMYHPTGVLKSIAIFDLVIKNNTYILFGGAQIPGVVWDTFHRKQSVILATDTAGVEQWHYASPIAALKDCEIFILSGIPTQDGGYLYMTNGDVYNRGTGVSIDLAGKTKIIKIDAAHKKVWEVVLDKYFTGFGTVNNRLLELADSSFLMMGGKATDSTAPNYIKGTFVLAHYKADGSLIYQHTLISPRDATDTSSGSSSGCYDILRMSDKGFLMAGQYYNNTVGVPLPIQKGWLIKLDSNGCLGAADTNCHPVSIAKVVSSTSAYKLYPNPNNGSFTIASMSHPPIISGRGATLKVYDLLGNVIYEGRLKDKESNIQIGNVAGVYVAEIKDEEGNLWREKIVIE